MEQSNKDMKDRLKVLLLLHSLSRTGAPKIALDIVEELAADVSFMVVSLEGGALAGRCGELAPTAVVGDLPSGNTWSRRARRKLAKWGLERQLARWGPDVVYVNSVAALPLVRGLRLPARPMILHVHELDSYLAVYRASHEEELVRRPIRYIAVAEAVREAMVRVAGIGGEQVEVIPEFIRMDQRPTEAAGQDRLDGKYVIGGAGETNMRKGVESWLRMAVELRRLRDDVRFVWVGLIGGVEGEIYRGMARKLGVGAVVEFVTHTDRPLDYYRGFDVLAMTSWEDPCPIVVLEAMSLGKAVACFSGAGGAPEEVGETGAVVDGFCPRQMAEAIDGMIREGRIGGHWAQARRDRIWERFSSRAVIPQIREQIATAAGMRGRGRCL